MARSQPFGRRSARLMYAATVSGSVGLIRPNSSSRSSEVRTVRSDSRAYLVSVETAGKA
jgi:hypothetical protein